MRIPSQFNEDSLYNRQTDRRVQRGESVAAKRQLIRLALGLILVIVVMKQVAKPDLYNPFFSEHVSPPSFSPAALTSRPTESMEASSFDIPASIRREADWIALKIPVKQQSLWLAALLRQQRQDAEATEKPGDIPRWGINGQMPDGWIEGLFADASAPGQDEQRDKWLNLLEQVRSAMESPKGPPVEGVLSSSQDRQRAAALIDSLDQLATSRVVDGGVWNSKDLDALNRYVDQARDLLGQYKRSPRSFPSELPPQIGILPLLQQPQVYRGMSVSFRGRIARVERQANSANSNSSNAYGLDGYYRLWLRPLSGTDRPLLAIVPDLPSGMSELSPESNLDKTPPVTIAGRFLKRLAYRSSAGPDLAPVIVGRIVSEPSHARNAEASSQNSIPTGTAKSRWSMRLSTPPTWALVVTAFLVGAGLAGCLFYRATVQAKRIRQLRESNLKDPTAYLKELETDWSPSESIQKNEASI